MGENAEETVSKLVIKALSEPIEETKINYLRKILPKALEGDCVAQLCLEHYFEACHARNERMSLVPFMAKVQEVGESGGFSCGDSQEGKIAALIFDKGPAYLAHALGYPDNNLSENVKQSRQRVKDCFESVIESACEGTGGCTAFCSVEFVFKQVRLIQKRKEEETRPKQ